jgi:3'-phosphoadenosine 5'-phosphosulfate sulfotransferase (PAPS reductase)/FAD synthetase
MKNTSHINPLENEAIYIFREVVAQFENPVLLFILQKFLFHYFILIRDTTSQKPLNLETD